jgi:hypothetical protein
MEWRVLLESQGWLGQRAWLVPSEQVMEWPVLLE